MEEFKNDGSYTIIAGTCIWCEKKIRNISWEEVNGNLFHSECYIKYQRECEKEIFSSEEAFGSENLYELFCYRSTKSKTF